ncbi:MAG TPA: YbjN domain-containing protein [Flavipsychrobacter sp.]|nr:YbjN domain-containing protein [Flavipsychrobacter sp.]
MGWLDKLLGKKEEIKSTPANGTPQNDNSPAATSAIFTLPGLEQIRFGRYSDNNKSVEKTRSWYRAEDTFKEKSYTESFGAVFDYLRDETEDNVRYRPDGKCFSFELTQGSKTLRGECDGETIVARVPLARMTTPTTAVMRRLLDINYNLFYCRSAMDEQHILYFVFDSDVPSASPNKMYYALREMATKADRLDDMLLDDFDTLVETGTEHIRKTDSAELDVKYKYFRKWIEEVLAKASELNADSFSGSIAYLYLTLLYRIEFLITPHGKLMSTMEKISGLYWNKKEEIPLVERNQMMKEALQKLLDITREEFAASVYQTKASFAITNPPFWDKLREYIVNANKDSAWYVDNKYPELALIISEYGMVYNQFIHSMPKVMSDLTLIYMAVMHSEYFAELGMKELFYDKEKKELNRSAIERAVNNAVKRYKDKYKDMYWDAGKVKYNSLFDFSVSFSDQMANLNMETKRS